MDLKCEKKKIKQGFRYVIGCDEVGRGSLAGPVVAGAVILKLDEMKFMEQTEWFHEIRDSKLLTAKKREELSSFLKESILGWSVGAVKPGVIDKINIHHATLKAMNLAVKKILKNVFREPQNFWNRFCCMSNRKNIFVGRWKV